MVSSMTCRTSISENHRARSGLGKIHDVLMATLHTASTADLSTTAMNDLRALLDAAFDGEWSQDDWQHALGGTHVWLAEGRGIVSHASLVERTLVCGSHRLDVGYVEAVATLPAHRRRGHAGQVMQRVGGLISERYPLGVLSTGAHVFYQTFGWEAWRGPTFVNGPHGRERTAVEDGNIMILRTSRSPRLDLDADIVCDWRPGDVW
jgi:aminoglycoside 2'-N-acetyltransferase I